MDRFGKIVLAVAAVVVVVLALIYRSDAVNTEDDLNKAEIDRALIAQSVNELREQIMDLGEEPVAPPAEDIVDGELPEIELIPGPPGRQGRQGDKGDKGDPGEDAPPPSVGLIESALRIICDDCRGPQGDTGVAGPAGETGATGDTGIAGEIGATGPAGESIVGPQGVQGETGATGPAGVGIANIRLVIDGDNVCHLLVTLTDGSPEFEVGSWSCKTAPPIGVP